METRTLGLITAPDYAKEITEKLKDELPELLNYYIHENIEWHIDYYTDSLTGGTNRSDKALEWAHDKKKDKAWDYAIVLTDLPLFHEQKPVVAGGSSDEDVAFISLPGFGLAPMYKRVRESILQLMNEIYYGSSDAEREEAEQKIRSKEDRHDDLKNKNARRLIGKRPFEILSPLDRETPEGRDTDTDVRFTVKSRLSGYIRIISGMVNANRPWELFRAFLKILIIAFTTGSYALVFPTLWQMSTNYSIGRAAVMTIVSILALVTWVIISNKLWERKMDEDKGFIRRLYNATTFFTMLLTVCMYYIVLFIMFTTITLFLIPPAQVASNISASSAHLTDYLFTTWIGTSISIIIGALGTGLDNEDVVLNSAYGYRQQQRREEIRKLEEEEES